MSTLLVASTGGHLTELWHLSKRFDDQDRVWMTFDTPQSRSLLQDEEVVFAPPSTSRDIPGTFRDALFARNFYKTIRFDSVVSTGASVAVATLPLARRHGMTSSYIESATRPAGPSLTGRILSTVKSINLFTQYENCANRRWSYCGSLFDAFEPAKANSGEIKSVLVSLGTHRRYGFRRALETLVKIIPKDVDVVWQVGSTPFEDLGINGKDTLPTDEMAELTRASDLVITHAGVGSSLACLEAGKTPLLLTRQQSFDEHVDDHQVALGAELEARGLAVARTAASVNWSDAKRAAIGSVVLASQPPRISF